MHTQNKSTAAGHTLTDALAGLKANINEAAGRAGHTAGAERAARQWIEPIKGNRLHEESVSELAALIDRETAAPGLLEALEKSVAVMDNTPGLGEAGRHILRAARAAIARAKGVQS